MENELKTPSQYLKFTRPLRDTQKAALDRFARENEAGLLWEMGTGKTTLAIALLRWKFACAGKVERTLIVTPVATLYNWIEEFQLNSPEKVHSTTLVLDQKGEKRAVALSMPGKEIFIVNGDALDQKNFYLKLSTMTFDNVIVDEAHKFKNYASKRFKKLITISDRTKHRIVMTGTPIGNNYLDVWAIWRILDKGKTFGTNYFSFRSKFFYDKNAGFSSKEHYFPNWQPLPGLDEVIPQMMAAKSSRVTKKECLDLPDIIYEKRYVPMADDQHKAYEAMEEELIAEVQAGTCAATNALSKCTRLLQITSGFLPVEIEGEVAKTSIHFKQNPKLDALYDLLEELTVNHKVIVWCTYKENYAMIRAVCDELKIQYTELVGGMKDPQANIERFQKDPECRVIMANEQAGGAGVNLTAASYAIYYGRTYSFLNRYQSEARNHRGGSEIHDKITIIDLVTKNTIDEVVLAALKKKESFSDNVLERIRALRGK